MRKGETGNSVYKDLQRLAGALGVAEEDCIR